MKIKFVHPVNAEKVEFTVAMSVPTVDITLILENILDSLPVTPVDHRFTLGKDIVSSVNKALKHNAIETVAHSGNIWKAMADRVTYGAYIMAKAEDGESYTLGNVNVVTKTVTIKEKGKDKKVERPAFVTYSDVVKYVNAYNKEAKKDNRTAMLIDGKFNDDEMRKLRYFIKCANGTLSPVEIETLGKRGEEYAPFLMDKDSADGKKARVQIFYDIFNRHTGKAVKAIQWIENDIVKECTSFNSMYKIDKNAGETAYITALFNNWLNSELVTAVQHRAKNPETDGKGKGKKKK